MNSEKRLVIYYSNSGYTKKLAKEISRNLNCDIEEIKTPVSYAGFFGYQRALLQAIFKRVPKIKKLKHNPADYDLVIVGGPVWGGAVSGPIRSFLAEYRDNLKDVAFFLTQGGQYGRGKVFEQMEQVSGKNPMAYLAVTDKELSNGVFRERILYFLSELQEQTPTMVSKRVPKQTRQTASTRLSTRPT
ncbi:MAG: flavodoxin [Bacteriovorax sp.]|nr:flavodoxin [Bacteriovorax sp.]